MRNIVKVLALILILSVILRDTEGARLNAVKVDGFHDPRYDPRITTGSPPVSGGNNVTHTSGSVMSWEKLTFSRFDKISRPELAR